MITIAELTKILKPHKYTNHLELAARFLYLIKEAQDAGEDHYEIGRFHTRNGCPFVVHF